jgi:hypothetical protein
MRKNYIKRADSKLNILLLLGLSRPLDFLIYIMYSRIFASIKGISIIENSGFELNYNGS